MAKFLAMLFLLLQLISFNVFGEELESLHKPALLDKPTPLHPPQNSTLHHHHNRNLSPTSAHTPLHPSHHAKPPTHHHPNHPPAHAPIQPPTHHHYRHPPARAPVHQQHPSAHAPVQYPTRHHYRNNPPSHAPVPKPTPIHPPFHVPIPIKSRIAVQGVVYVKSCKHARDDSLLNATSLNGAIVKLQCNNTNHNVVRKGKTDKNGYFYIKGSKDISNFAAHKCNVVLDSAPNELKPSNLHGGITGAVLKRKKSYVSKGHVLILYNVKPLAFEPKCTL